MKKIFYKILDVCLKVSNCFQYFHFICYAVTLSYLEKSRSFRDFERLLFKQIFKLNSWYNEQCTVLFFFFFFGPNVLYSLLRYIKISISFLLANRYPIESRRYVSLWNNSSHLTGVVFYPETSSTEVVLARPINFYRQRYKSECRSFFIISFPRYCESRC